MKARGVKDVISFPFLDPPTWESLEKALLQLLQLGALTETGEISDTGLKIAKLPLTPTLGRVLVEAANPERDCLLDVIDIISCLSVENIFLNLITEEKKEEAEVARRELYRREGDHLTLLATVQAYASEQTDRKAWAEKHYILHRAMQNIMVGYMPGPISNAATNIMLGYSQATPPAMYAAEATTRIGGYLYNTSIFGNALK